MIKYLHNLFKGRINRSTYSIELFLLFVTFVLIKVIMIFVMALSELNIMIVNISILCLAIIFYISTITYAISLMVRRLHDFNQSGFWSLLIITIPLAWMILSFIEGSNKNNEYGHPPK